MTQVLQPGDLFSTQGQFDWDKDLARVEAGDPVIGMRVYIRTDAPCPEDQADQLVYRIEIHRDPEDREEAMP